MARTQVIHYQTRMFWVEWKHAYMRYTACGLQFSGEIYLYSPNPRDVTCKKCCRAAALTGRVAAALGKE